MEEEINKIWQLARIYDKLSHTYSNVSDDLVKLAQEMEEKNEN